MPTPAINTRVPDAARRTPSTLIVVTVADAIFEEPRLAEIYDHLEPNRPDLELYLSLVGEFGARSVLDIGSGTGTFACLLASRGIEVTAVDPAAASLAVARAKPGANRVRWWHGDATTLPPLQVDIATMTGNVAQVFTTDSEWVSTLHATRRALRPDGRLVFESRVPEKRAWLEWNRQQSYRRTLIPSVGPVESWVDVTEVDGSLVTFRKTFIFESDGAVLTSDSTLRFRSRAEIASSVLVSGMTVEHVRDAPDRPGLEFVFIARRAA